jgi:hypothetical protein
MRDYKLGKLSSNKIPFAFIFSVEAVRLSWQALQA